MISESPLQMLWRIKWEKMSMKEMKELAKINQIEGKSKLNIPADYIAAFMKL